ncbi:MmgE/PrpD family protein [Providencia burhodogranariea]|uniref:2-methylcitrate dehydratase n=1 Tax=Providencia burhodogranariea DSM 19968 TaxID=1141662 RepID=K8X5Y3_9GAMM|nr:MmgE/PrpD family protein [Providencia burhodogranariea]EKT65072.1 2-methylcitrate dehydratase [Providencia burhodogranariea DSM 19968]
MNSDLTIALAEKIIGASPPSSAQKAARDGIKDYLAVTLSVTEGHINDEGWLQLCKLWPERDPRSLALLLGYAGHALDFDDFHAHFRGHPSTVILPALFAVFPSQAVIDNGRFLNAYCVGIEVAGRLGLAMTHQHYQLGFHSTGSLGVIAATAALCYLLEADVDTTACSLGLAATQASALRAQFGSAAKPLHAGLAAQSAVTSYQLASAGFSSRPHGVIDAFLDAMSSKQAIPELLIKDWGNPWRIETPGLEFKPYPTCAGTHSAAAVTQILRDRWLSSGKTLAGLIDNIYRIDVAFPLGGDIAANIRIPENGIEARFCLEYIIAAMLIKGDLLLGDFTEPQLDPQIMALAQRVFRNPDRSVPPDVLAPEKRFHQITLLLSGSMQLSHRLDRQQFLQLPVDLKQKWHNSLPNASYQEIETWLDLCLFDAPDSAMSIRQKLIASLN